MKTESSNNLKRYNNLIGEIESVYHDVSLKFGISDSVSKIIYTICDNGGSCMLSDIRKLTGLSKQTVNSSIRNLEKEDVVYLKAVDGKTKEVCFTQKGCEFAEKTAMRLIRIENEIFDSWDAEDVETYLRLTDRFLMCLTDKADGLQ